MMLALVDMLGAMPAKAMLALGDAIIAPITKDGAIPATPKPAAGAMMLTPVPADMLGAMPASTMPAVGALTVAPADTPGTAPAIAMSATGADIVTPAAAAAAGSEAIGVDARGANPSIDYVQYLSLV